MKICINCQTEKPLTEFHRNGSGGYKGNCKPCRAKLRKAHSNGPRSPYKHNPEKDRRAKLKYRYGLTVASWIDMFTEQQGLCAICGENEATDIDHDHATGQVRGLLCGGCNKGLGLFKDNPEFLKRAADYLDS